MARLKHSVAVLIQRGDQILAVRRLDTDDELPGVWGLPAGTLREGEDVQDLVMRIGRDKLGVTLIPLRRIAAGVQDRPNYRLEMELWEVLMEETPNYPEWQWANVDLLRPGMEAGSLCCQLAINSKSRAS
jgi:ADP-ribose pyrophosphatase YjhB (NUDIX family)